MVGAGAPQTALGGPRPRSGPSIRGIVTWRAGLAWSPTQCMDGGTRFGAIVQHAGAAGGLRAQAQRGAPAPPPAIGESHAASRSSPCCPRVVLPGLVPWAELQLGRFPGKERESEGRTLYTGNVVLRSGVADSRMRLLLCEHAVGSGSRQCRDGGSATPCSAQENKILKTRIKRLHNMMVLSLRLSSALTVAPVDNRVTSLSVGARRRRGGPMHVCTSKSACTSHGHRSAADGRA